MRRRTRRLILVAVLLVGFGPAIGWWWWKRTRFASVDALVAARFQPRPCPQPDFGRGDAYAVRCDRCFAGELRPGVPEVLMLCARYRGTTQVQKLPVPAVQYLTGFWLPPEVKVDDAWLARWRAAEDVVLAARTGDGGAAVVFGELPSAGGIEAREAALRSSL